MASSAVSVLRLKKEVCDTPDIVPINQPGYVFTAESVNAPICWFIKVKPLVGFITIKASTIPHVGDYIKPECEVPILLPAEGLKVKKVTHSIKEGYHAVYIETEDEVVS